MFGCAGIIYETASGAAGFCFAFDVASNQVGPMLALTAGEGAGVWMAGQGVVAHRKQRLRWRHAVGMAGMSAPSEALKRPVNGGRSMSLKNAKLEYASADVLGDARGGMPGGFCSGSSYGADPNSAILVCTIPYGDANAQIVNGRMLVYDPVHLAADGSLKVL